MAQAYSRTSGIRTEELAQSGKALPAFAGNVFLCFRRLAIAAPYQNAFLLIWIWESVENRCAGITVFHWFYKGIQSTVFVLTRGTVVHGATHAAPMRNVDLPLVLQGSPCRTACAQLRDPATSQFPWACHFAHFACFSNGFRRFLINHVGRYFSGQAELARNHCFYKGFEGFLAPVLSWPGLLPIDLQRQAPAMLLYVTY